MGAANTSRNQVAVIGEKLDSGSAGTELSCLPALTDQLSSRAAGGSVIRGPSSEWESGEIQQSEAAAAGTVAPVTAISDRAEMRRAGSASKVSLMRWLPGLLVLGAIWGSSFLFIKVGISQLHPAYVAFGRVASGAVTLLVILILMRASLPRSFASWGHNAVVAVIGVAAPFTLFGYGEQRVSSILAGIWNSITPLVVLPLAVIVFRTEKMTARRLIGLILGVIGAFIILGVWQGSGDSSLAGQLMCLAAASCYGVAIPYTQKFLSRRPESGLAMSAAQLIVASAVLALVAPVLGAPVPDLGELSWQVIGSVLTLGAVGTGIAFVIHLRNIRVVGATTASMVTYIIPIFATALGAVVLGERIAWYQPIGAAAVLLGVAVAQGVRFRRTRVEVPVGAR